MTGGAIAGRPEEYFAYIHTPVFQRKRTAECEKDALDMLEAYRDFNKISEEQYCIAESKILEAPHDDAISDIMCRLRHKINW